MYVSQKDATKQAIKPIKQEGINIGISTGALIYIANIIAKKEENKKILIIAPDGIEKYLTDLNI